MQELEWKWNNKRETGLPMECGEEEMKLLENSISDLKNKLHLNRNTKII